MIPVSRALWATAPQALLLAASLLLAAAPAGAGPAFACPGGPDPLRFRPELAVAPTATDPAPVSVAAARDDASGAEIIALAFLTPAREVAVALSVNGGCSFGAPVVVSAPGIVVTDRPAIALRLTAPVGLCVAWREADRIVARESPVSTTFDPEFILATRATSPPLLSWTQGGTSMLAAAWLEDDLGPAAASPRVALRDASGTWAPAVEVLPPRPALEIGLACDHAGLGDEPACSLLALLDAGEAFVSRLDRAGGTWGAYRRADDGRGSSISRAAIAASSVGSAEAWNALAWLRLNRTGPAVTALVADAARLASGLLASDYDGPAGTTQAVPASPVASGARIALAVAGASPGATAFLAFEQAGEIHLARRPLSDARPRFGGGCGPARLTGLFPARTGGQARAPAAAALGDDVVLAFADNRSGAWEVFVKRSDSAAQAVTMAAANPTACGTAPRIDVSWSAPPCDAASAMLEVGLGAGATDFTRVAPLAGPLQVEGLDPGTTYWFRVRLTDVSGNEAVSDEISATTPSCSSALIQGSLVSAADACAAGGAGGDGLVDPGETARVTFRFRNDGTATAMAARARLLSRSSFVTIRSGAVSLGDLAPGGTADAAFDLDVSATAPCAPLEVLARTEIGGVHWAELLALPGSATCTPCRDAGCSVTADPSGSAPRVICSGSQMTLDATASSIANCAGTILHEWWAGTVSQGTGTTLSRSPTSSVSYRLVSRCSTDFDCFDEATVFVTVNPRPTVTIEQIGPSPACDGATIVLVASSNAPSADFAWDDGTTGAMRDVTSSGVHQVTVTDANGCSSSVSTRVQLDPLPLADAGPDVDSCGAARIGTPGFPVLDYEWTPPDHLSDPRAPQPHASPPMPTDYTLTVTDPLSGCTATDVVRVTITSAPAAPVALRVSRTGSELALSWEALPGALGGRVYSDTEAERAANANGGSPTALRLCEGATSCTTPMPVEALTFLQVVSICADGSGEGPN